jgi:hemolysin activation/secretion protein
LRSKPSNLYLLLNYNFSSFLNYANSATSSQYSTSVFQSGIYGNRLDNFGGGAVNSASIYASSGWVNLSNSPSLTSDTNGPGINGGFNKLHYSLIRQQTVSSKVAILVGVSGQVASKNMDASEQMYMGGPYGVRSYATGQGNANQGITQSVEIFENLPSNFTLSQFYDYANIQTYKQSNFSGAPSDNGYSLQGVGTSLVWTGSNGLKLKAIWARRIGTLPTSIYETFIANGGLASNRFWLNASLSF